MPCSCHGHGLLVRNAAPTRNVRSNPLRVDPTRTSMISRRFMAEIRRRFAKLRKAVIDFIVVKDALGLGVRHSIVIRNVQEREYEFRTDANKLAAFNAWFREQVERDVFSVAAGLNVNEPWLAEYVESAYKRGLLNAYLSSKEAELMAAEGIGEQTQEQFLRSAFLAPEAMNKVQLLATRSWEGMKGITASMGVELNRILAEGMINGSGPRTIAREMVAKIDGMTGQRALLIARTEIVGAHAEGQLDAFQKLGVEELGVRAEWVTAGDDRVCEFCAAEEGKVFSIEEARGIIPLHPSCRCSWTPRILTNAEMARERQRQERLDVIRGKEPTPAAAAGPGTEEEEEG